MESLAPPFDAFARHVLDLYQPPLRAAKTRQRMRQLLRIVATCPTVATAADLDARMVAWFVAFRKNFVRANSLIGELGYLRAACAIAEDAGWIDRSPFRARRRFAIRAEPPESKKHHATADVARVLAHLARAPDWKGRRLHALACTVAYTGLRRDEAFYLQVGDVDLAERLILVVPRRRLKTVGAAQPVPCPPELARVLAAWLPDAGPTWLFPTLSRKGPWTGGSPGTKPLDRLKAAGEACGVPGFTFLSLRHTWATAAEGAWGLTEPQIQRALRHTRPLTQRRYRHADAEALRRIGERVDFAA